LRCTGGVPTGFPSPRWGVQYSPRLVQAGGHLAGGGGMRREPLPGPWAPPAAHRGMPMPMQGLQGVKGMRGGAMRKGSSLNPSMLRRRGSGAWTCCLRPASWQARGASWQLRGASWQRKGPTQQWPWFLLKSGLLLRGVMHPTLNSTTTEFRTLGAGSTAASARVAAVGCGCRRRKWGLQRKPGRGRKPPHRRGTGALVHRGRTRAQGAASRGGRQ